MSIEFIRDEFLEGKKEELDKINEILSSKPVKIDRSTLFLKRFTLALMGQYKVKHLYEKPKETEQLNKQIFEKQRIIPNAPSPQRISMQNIPFPRLQIPVPQRIQPQLKIPKPLNGTLKIPEPIIIEHLPKEMLKIKFDPMIYIGTTDSIQQKSREKKEFNIPNPL